MTREINLDFDLWPKQLQALNSCATELLYGGAAGGGKSHLERVMSILWCLEIPGLQYYLFRRSFQDLIKSYVEGPTGYLAMLGPLIQEGDAEKVAKEIRFPNGSKIYLCHCQHEKNVFDFGSYEFHVLNVAEAGEFTPFMIRYLRSRVRMPEQFNDKIPEKYLIPKQYWRDQSKREYQFPRMIMTANPVGPGKAYLKKAFVDDRISSEIWRASNEDGGMLRQFISARLNDNPSLDPVAYAARLQGIGSRGYIDALLEGRWDATIGAFFPQLDKDLHLIRPFMIPKHWPRFVAYDHGACGEGDPFSVGWYTIAGEDVAVRSSLTGTVLVCQRESMVCYRRWNGRGLPKMNAAQIADGIKQREKSEEILFRVAGGDIMEQRGHGESIFSIFAQYGIKFRRADMRRQNGWGQVDYRLDGRNGYPLSFWFEECEEDLDTISTLQYHATDLGDVAAGDDHDADRHRYACMTRPQAVGIREEPEPGYRDKNKRSTVSQIVHRITQPERSTYVSRR